jgi:hypothetical protein
VNDEELREFLGPVGSREYDNATDYHKKEVRAFVASVGKMSDLEFVKEAAFRIEESARWSSSRGNWEGVHAMATGCYKEAQRRYAAAGHAKDCKGSDLYVKAHSKALVRNGHDPNEIRDCTCGVVKK